MIIKQEEGNTINDFILKHNVEKVFSKLIEMTEQTSVETEELKIFTQETVKLLKGFSSHIEKIEKEETKINAKRKFCELVKKGNVFED